MCYLHEIVSAMGPDHTSVMTKIKRAWKNPALHRLTLSSFRKCPTSVLQPSLQPEQGQALNDPTKCNPVVQHPPLSCGKKNQLQPDENFHMRQMSPQAGEQRDSVEKMSPSRETARSPHPGGPLV